jgi:asparagine synthetase B (glutamine-hydrolysing)
VIFSTSLRVLERLPEIPRRADLRAYAEQEAFCYPLGSRTLYRDVKTLRDGECLVAGEGGLRVQSYMRWADTPIIRESREAIVARCYSAFMAALSSRIRHRTVRYALLSGGLDSRCIAAGLKELGADFTALNCAVAGSQDYEYAHRFAEAAGIPFQNVPWSPDLLGTRPGATTAGLLAYAAQHVSPGLVFSGDGGGETIGFLIMTEPVMKMFREGRVQDAIEAYVKNPPVPKHLFTNEVYAAIADAPRRGMEEEIRRQGNVPPEKAMQLFLLTNDLRCHLHEFFDRTLEHRLELLLPFYDRRVIESVVRIPTPFEEYLRHRLYHDWLKLFPPAVTSVPWQAYPTHLPCPVADPDPPMTQNTIYKRHVPAASRRWMQRTVRAALKPGFPASIMSRNRLLLAVLLHRLHVRDYSYVFKTFINVDELLSRSTVTVLDPAPEHTRKDSPQAGAALTNVS